MIRRREVRLALTKSLPAYFYDLLIVIRFAAESHLDAFHRSAFCIEMLIAAPHFVPFHGGLTPDAVFLLIADAEKTLLRRLVRASHQTQSVKNQ